MKKIILFVLLHFLCFATSDAQEAGKADTSKIDIFADPEIPASIDMSLLADLFNKKLKYPQIALENGIEGKVYVSFVITETGEIKDFKVLRGIGYGCDEEAVRLLKLTQGMWTPGALNGKPVKCYMNFPVKFDLN